VSWDRDGIGPIDCTLKRDKRERDVMCMSMRGKGVWL
jgi:hypothetical protein